MEEAKMELMRTAKCPDNQVEYCVNQSRQKKRFITIFFFYIFFDFQGTPVLILANKQDLPLAKEPKELEKILSLHELSPFVTSVSSATLSSVDSNNLEKGSTSSSSVTKTSDQPPLKLWHIQPTCAITGEGMITLKAK